MTYGAAYNGQIVQTFVGLKKAEAQERVDALNEGKQAEHQETAGRIAGLPKELRQSLEQAPLVEYELVKADPPTEPEELEAQRADDAVVEV